MVGIGELILVSNLLVTISLLVVTVYRAKIERNQIKTIVENANAMQKLRKLRVLIKTEKDMIIENFGQETHAFLLEVINDEN